MDGSQQPDILIIAGGESFDASLVADRHADTRVIAADSGLDHAMAIWLDVHLAVGDMDSVSQTALAWAREHGTEIEVHPADKDQTDLQLALDAAAPRGGKTVIVGAHGGRLDHELANLLLAGAPQYAALDLELRSPKGRAWIVRDRLDLALQPGDTITLLALHGTARGVSIAGVRWPLDHVVLEAGSTWGVSNEATQPDVTVSVDDGVVVAIVPDLQETM